MNLVEVSGNLTRDPDLRYSQNDKAYCKFSVAVNTGYGDRQKTDFVPVTVFGRQAENCDKYLRKGSKVLIAGSLESGSYEADTGETVYTLGVIADDVEFIGRKMKGENDEEVPDFEEQFEDIE